MSYGLMTGRGVQGLGVLRPRMRGYRLRGFGDTPLIPLPNYATCDPRDVQCTINNQGLSDKYNADLQQAQAANNLNECLQNANNATSDAQRQQVLAACSGQYATQGGSPSAPVYTGGPGSVPFTYPVSSAPVTAVALRPGTFSFSTSRGSNAMQVGDTWLVSISGASPNIQVSVRGSMPGGSIPATAEGQTDGNGNYSKSGTVGPGEIGSWQEIWSVGSADTGSVSFTVSPAVAKQAAPAGAPAGGSQPASSAAASAAVSSGFDLSSIPWWGWAAGAGVAVIAFGGRR